MWECVLWILEISRNYRERVFGAVEFDVDVDVDVLNLNVMVVIFGDVDLFVECLVVFEVKNEVLMMKFEAFERVRRELCEKFECVMFCVKYDEMKF